MMREALPSTNTALVVFLVYTVIVFGLAWFAHRYGSKKSFMGEYFLGSRGLGMLALALTFGQQAHLPSLSPGFPL